MTIAKHHVPPNRVSDNPTTSTPHLATWKNYAWSCFAIHQKTTPTTTTYIHWSDEPNHATMLNLPNLILVAGALPPHSSTAFHSHPHNTFVLAVTDTPVFMFQNLQPPEYTHPLSPRVASLTRGSCFSQCPFSSKLPFVHRCITTNHRVAFVMIETSAPPLLQSAPILEVVKSPHVIVENSTPSNFWAAAEFKLGPDADVTIRSRSPSCPLPLARFICRIQSPLDDLNVQIPTHLQYQTVQKAFAETLVQTIAISGFKDSSDTCFRIHNTAKTAWSGFIVDIFGMVSS